MAVDPFIKAAALIAQNAELRALVRHLYEFSGMARNPFEPNALTMAHNSGKIAVMEELCSILNYHEPALIPRILLELNNERSRDADAARKSSRDGPGDDGDDDPRRDPFYTGL